MNALHETLEIDSNSMHVSHRAQALVKASRYADAALLYEQALQEVEHHEEAVLRIKYDYGCCLTLLGKLIKGLSYISGVISYAANKGDYLVIAASSLSRKVNILQKIQKIESNLPATNCHKIFDLINRVEQWSLDTGIIWLRTCLLLDKAEMLLVIGKKKEALTAAEESYGLKKEHDATGYHLGDHARKVAKLARIIGDYERAVSVLDELDATDAFFSPLCNAKLLRERVLILNARKPPRTDEALAAARHMIQYAEKIQGAHNTFYLYALLAETALAAHSLDEAKHALCMVCHAVLHDDTYYRNYLLRRSIAYFLNIKKDWMKDSTNKHSKDLQKCVDEYIKKTIRALQG